MLDDSLLIRRTVALAHRSVLEGGRPFSCLVARDGRVVAESAAQTDASVHAEVQAVRAARALLGSERLDGCEIYCIAQPCPRCLGFLRDAAPDRVVFLALQEEYEPYYPDTDPQEEFTGWLPMTYLQEPDAVDVARLWAANHVP
ncbi:deaminase [Streptomyces sp. NPDC051940]|uniref:nucleoside deaminase n=1 Tax=Streptomyces sp. NPDC051940 TaxID=3155675 RepID=UPI0034443E74